MVMMDYAGDAIASKSDCSANAYLIIIICLNLTPILTMKAEESAAYKFTLSVLYPVIIMKILVVQRLGLFGLVVAIATFTHQSAMQAEVRSPIAEAITQQIASSRTDLSAKLLPGSVAIAQPTPTLAQTNTPASGSFVSDAHPTSGNARIIEENGQRYLELDESFRSDAGPDLLVLLHKEAVPRSYNSDNYLNLGPMQRAVGTQRYVIPAEVDLNAFQSAVIWCRQFNVTFGYATL